MARHDHHLKFTEPISKPVRDTGASQVMECAYINIRTFFDLQELVSEITYRASALRGTPPALSSELLDIVIAFGCDKDIRIAFRLSCLVLCQQLDYFVR